MEAGGAQYNPVYHHSKSGRLAQVRQKYLERFVHRRFTFNFPSKLAIILIEEDGRILFLCHVGSVMASSYRPTTQCLEKCKPCHINTSDSAHESSS